MTKRKVYKVVVTELLRKIVTVEAKDEKEAHRRVSDAWQNGEYLLDDSDFDGAEFHVLGKWDGEGEKSTFAVDPKEEKR